jgi:hypothetical protein
MGGGIIFLYLGGRRGREGRRGSRVGEGGSHVGARRALRARGA